MYIILDLDNLKQSIFQINNNNPDLDIVVVHTFYSFKIIFLD